ncbi:hypothetical protein TanjilG_15682 [Lupinus angustifolius]|uniref:Uncharacterized protein n=1 Tax=Lupinus angustifolius TaxID=3871 RepID=A0A1J7HRB1_LUPAN|nr:hypothetical protein TanjilG_15682 [Lupinus angustifolius]
MQHSASPNARKPEAHIQLYDRGTPEAHIQLSDRGALTVSAKSGRIMTEAHKCSSAMPQAH